MGLLSILVVLQLAVVDQTYVQDKTVEQMFSNPVAEYKLND